MQAVTKELVCPGCGGVVTVRLLPGAATHTWHCPHCKAFQKTDKATADAAPVVAS